MTLYYEDFEVGRRFEPPPATITEGDVVSFAELTGDCNPLHTDDAFARGGPFKGRIAHGMLQASAALGLLARTGVLDGSVEALLEQSARFVAPVYPGDEVRASVEVVGTRPSSKGGRGVVTIEGTLSTSRGPTAHVRWVVLLRGRPVATS